MTKFLLKLDPLAPLYMSISVILFCNPLHKLFFRVWHIVPFTFALFAFYASFFCLLQFSLVQRWCKAVLFAVFNSLLFQLYFRMCMRSENLLSSNKPSTPIYWFFFSGAVTSLYLGQLLYEPLLPVFINAVILILILLYIQLRSSTLFDLCDKSNPVTWTSTLGLFSRQLGLETPLENKLVADEIYHSMLPRLGFVPMWKAFREAILRKVRQPSAFPSAAAQSPPNPPLPGIGGSQPLVESGGYSVFGAAIAAVITGGVAMDTQRQNLELNRQKHQDSIAVQRETLAVQRETLAVQQADLNMRELDQLRDIGKEQREILHTQELKLKGLANAKTSEALSAKVECVEAINHAKEVLKATQTKLDSIYLSRPSASEVMASASQKPSEVYSCFEPPVFSVSLEAECFTNASPHLLWFLGTFS
jgi:hypothetical protein